MRKLLFMLICLMLFIFTACNSKVSENNIPSLKVTFENENILVEKGGYKWTKKIGLVSNQSIIVDAAGLEGIANNMQGDEVIPEAELILDFSEKPNDVTIVEWENSNNSSYKLGDNKIIVPKEEGIYIYEIIGKWNEGEVSYTIKIIVPSKIDDNIKEIAYNWLDNQSKLSISDWKSASIDTIKFNEEHFVANTLDISINIQDKETYQVTFTTNDDILGPIIVYVDKENLNVLGVDYRE